MEDVNLIGESIKFMILGMLVVFAFLLILVEVMKLQAKLINKYFTQKPQSKKQSTTPTTTTDDEEARKVAAIIAAVAEFRKNQ
jgi:oxaloacetate decarboxylase gamma subunit